MRALCFDLGGTNLKVGLVEDGVLIKKDMTKTDITRGRFGIRQTLLRGLAMFAEEDYDMLCVSSAGRIDSERGTVIYATENLPGYTGFALREFLEGECHRPVYCLNDGYAAALGEYASRGQKNTRMLMLTLGTGVGGAYVENGAVVPFPTDRDMGHLPLYPDGRPCNCGRQGCIEQYISGTALHEELRLSNAPTLDKTELWEVYRQGTDPRVCAGIDRFCQNIRHTADTLYALRPFDLLVLGGGVSEAAHVWLTPALFDGAPYRAYACQSKNDAGMLGAYAFALSKM